MRMRTEFAHAERKRWRSAAGIAAMKAVDVLKPARESVERQLGALLGKSLERRRKNLDVSSKRGSRRRRQVKYHHTGQQRHPPVNSAQLRAGRSPRVRAGRPEAG